MRIIFQVILLE